MLQTVWVKNYVLIQEVILDIKTGLTVITGETGAGKSILANALLLLSGDRADYQVLNNPLEKCVIEATFKTQNPEISTLLEIEGLDDHEELILRREINPNQRSRAFINDTPVNLTVLKRVWSILIDIHSQHQSQELFDETFQLDLVDKIAEVSEEASQYLKNSIQLKSINHKIEAVSSQIFEAKKHRDFVQFQLTELDNTALFDVDELVQKSEKLNLLNQATALIETINNAENAFFNSDGNIIDTIKTSQKTLKPFFSITKKLENLEGLFNNLNEITEELSKNFQEILAEVDADMEEKVLIENRVDELNRLLYKHNAPTIASLFEIIENYRNEELQFDNLVQELEFLKSEKSSFEDKLHNKALLLSNARQKAIPIIEQNVNAFLNELGLDYAKFRISLTINSTLGKAKLGYNDMEWQFCANPGSEFQPLAKVASGGEISRVVLALKQLTALKNELPTLIFDEIDTGISGEAAKKVGEVLRKLSEKHQVICITHLAQIASKGKNHLYVKKELDQNQTITTFEYLNEERREIEIAKMISGNDINDSTLLTARTLLKQ